MRVQCSGLVVCLLVIVYCNADPVANLKKCKPTDNACMKDSAQAYITTFIKGFPELGVENMEPIIVKRMDASGSGLKLILTDCTFKGLSGCRVKKMSRDLEKSKVFAKAQCELSLDGKYDMSGNLVILPIQGNGPIHVKLHKINLNIEAQMEEKPGAGGKTYWHIKSWTHSFTLKETADVEFGNLYPDNKVLGDAARQVIRDNSNEIVYTVGAPVVKAVITRILGNVNKFFNSVPYEDLVDVE